MIYEYSCLHCHNRFDVIKSYRDMERNETCTRCGEFAERKFVPSRVHFIGTSVQNPEYNPGLGQIVRNKQHRAELAKQKGLIEVGTEPVEKLHKAADDTREEKINKAYDDAVKGWVGDGSS